MTPLASLFVLLAFKVTDTWPRHKDYGQQFYAAMGHDILRRRIQIAFLSVLIVLPGFASAQERGSVTNLPIPRFVSIEVDEANVRRGPSMTNRVDWIFQAEGLPVEITAEYGLWRRIRDRDGVGGWVHHALISGVRTGIVDVDMAALRIRPDPSAAIRAQLERNVIGRFLSCDGSWCRFQAGGYRGWILQSEVWGTRPGEIIE